MDNKKIHEEIERIKREIKETEGEPWIHPDSEINKKWHVWNKELIKKHREGE